MSPVKTPSRFSMTSTRFVKMQNTQSKSDGQILFSIRTRVKELAEAKTAMTMIQEVQTKDARGEPEVVLNLAAAGLGGMTSQARSLEAGTTSPGGGILIAGMLVGTVSEIAIEAAIKIGGGRPRRAVGVAIHGMIPAGQTMGGHPVPAVGGGRTAVARVAGNQREATTAEATTRSATTEMITVTADQITAIAEMTTVTIGMTTAATIEEQLTGTLEMIDSEQEEARLILLLPACSSVVYHQISKMLLWSMYFQHTARSSTYI
mmetsp:Transcript_44789/g.78856  ORF Transcript_44789/g.78856 Transcript_44789/m.78856 type:complete len:262 (+) Transcript_44789:679-1464(+)